MGCPYHTLQALSASLGHPGSRDRFLVKIVRSHFAERSPTALPRESFGPFSFRNLEYDEDVSEAGLKAAAP
jgi:hypothetical protein